MDPDTTEDNQPHVRVTLERIYERQLLQGEQLIPIPTMAKDLSDIKDWRRQVDIAHVRLEDRMNGVEVKAEVALAARTKIEDEVREVRDRKTIAPWQMWSGIIALAGLAVAAFAIFR